HSTTDIYTLSLHDALPILLEVKQLLNDNKINEAMDLCDEQQGSLGNVVKEGLTTYRNLANDTTMDKEQKMFALTKALEEATTLEDRKSTRLNSSHVKISYA